MRPSRLRRPPVPEQVAARLAARHRQLLPVGPVADPLPGKPQGVPNHGPRHGPAQYALAQAQRPQPRDEGHALPLYLF